MVGSKFDLVGLYGIGCEEDIPETGHTLDENSELKARYVLEKYGLDCFADDTGLEVEALNGDPGVYSARYAGVDRDAQRNMNLLLNNLKDKDNRKCQFRTVITLLWKGKMHRFEGIVRGEISERAQGAEGFGYDPIFIPEGYTQTFAEMAMEEKNTISHRGRAMAKLTDFLLNQA